MITTANITMQFGAKPLFEDISVKFGDGNRYGLIGANGCGKSSLFAMLLGELEPDEVTADHRRSAKAINFGLMYGMSAFGLAKQLDISRGEAQEYVDLYFSRYPGVHDYMERTREQAHEQGRQADSHFDQQRVPFL